MMRSSVATLGTTTPRSYALSVDAEVPARDANSFPVRPVLRFTAEMIEAASIDLDYQIR
jgi:hypothetical protein